MQPTSQSNTSSPSSSPASAGSSIPSQPVDAAPIDSSTSPRPTNTTPTDPASTPPTTPITDAPMLSSKFSLPTHAPIWLTVAAVLFGIFSIAFGAFELTQHIAAQDEIDVLRAEVEEKDQTITKLGAQLGLVVDGYNNPNYTAPGPNDIKIASSDYIYIGEWGIKIKIPSTLKSVSYLFDNLEYTADTISYRPHLVIAGLSQDSTSYPGFANLAVNPSGLGAISRYRLSDTTLDSDEKSQLLEQAVYKDKEYFYVYSHPQAVFSSDSDARQQELVITKLIQNMLTNPNNYSTF